MEICYELPYFFAVSEGESHKIYRSTTHKMFKINVNIVNEETDDVNYTIRNIARYNKMELQQHISFVRKWNDKTYSSCEWFYTNKVLTSGETTIPILRFENCRTDILSN